MIEFLAIGISWTLSVGILLLDREQHSFLLKDPRTSLIFSFHVEENLPYRDKVIGGYTVWYPAKLFSFSDRFICPLKVCIITMIILLFRL